MPSEVNNTNLVMSINLTRMSPGVKRRSGQHHGDLRNALLAAGLELVAESGPRGLSMAEAARRAGVSVAAPYKHFTDRDALLAALAERGYKMQLRLFATALETSTEPTEQLAAVAIAYVEFAVQERPLFEVVFGSGLVKADHPDLAAAGSAVLELLIPPCAAIRPQDPEGLLVAVAALAHGYAALLLDGMLGPAEDALPHVCHRVAAGTRALLADGSLRDAGTTDSSVLAG